MSLIDLIREHALASAEAGDWQTVADTLNALTHTVKVGKVGGKDSLQALVAAGEDPNAVIGAMRAVPTASVLLDTLISSGVDWSDPLSEMIMNGLVASGKISQRAADSVRALSERTEAVIITIADDCQRAWIIGSAKTRLQQITSKATAIQAWLDVSGDIPIGDLADWVDSLFSSADGNPS